MPEEGVFYKLRRFLKPSGVDTEHRKYVKVLGRVGFVAKGIVYAIIGGLTCASALQQPLPRGTEGNESPQGAFILLAGAEGIGIPLLCVMAAGLIFYSSWRFWEAITGQGSDRKFSKSKNFFKYRLSPFVSGAVYLSYLIYILQTIFKLKAHLSQEEISTPTNCFPNCWVTSTAGKVGVILIGIAFLVATITQLIPAFTGSFKPELKTHLFSWPLRIVIHTMGHVGFLGRAGVFLLVAILMFKAVHNDVNSTKYTVGVAIDQLRSNTASKTFMFILGIFLVDFGAFAVLNSWCKFFPTKPTSGQHAGPGEGLDGALGKTEDIWP